MVRPFTGAALVVLCGALVCASPGEGGTLTGTVRARDGARLPFAVLVVNRDDRPGTWRLVSGARGAFHLQGLPPGRYTLVIQAAGFSDSVITDVVLRSPDDRHVLDLVLELAAVREAVTVTGALPRDGLEAGAIREAAPRDVAEALSAQAGVWQLRKGAIANDVVLRGLQSRDLNVLVDGQRTYGACPNRMDPPAFHVDFAEVERVEVSKGPFDVRHQGSLGGVVNVVTRAPQGGWHGAAALAIGAGGYVNPSAVTSYGRAPWFALGGASFRRAAPYRDGAGRPVTAVANYRVAEEDEAFRVASGWTRGVWRPGGAHVQASYTRQQADDVLYPYLLMDGIEDVTDRASVRYEHAAAGVVERLRAEAYHARVAHWMTDERRVSASGASRAYSMATDALAVTSGGRVEAASGALTTGVELVRRRWDTRTALAPRKYAEQASIPDVVIASVGAYADWRRALGARATLEAGARLDRVTSAADEALANTDLYFAYQQTRATSRVDLLPAAKLRVAWSLGDVRVGLGVGHVPRVPEANERYFALQRMGSDWVGHPGLAPSRNTGAEATMSWSRGGRSLDVQAFVQHVADYIAVRDRPRIVPVPGVVNSAARSYENVTARLAGGEVSASLPLTGRLFLSADVSYTRGTELVAGAAALPLAEMPPLRAKARLRFDDGRVFVLAEAVATADQRRVDRRLGETPVPGAAIANITGGMRPGRLSISVGVTNLFDRQYLDALSYQRDPFRTGARVSEPGRQWFGNAVWAW